MAPSIGNNSEQWAAREWVSPFAGQATISGKFYKLNLNPASTGVYCRMYLNHTQIYSQYIAGTDSTGATFSLPVTLKLGDVLDFTIAPNAGNSDSSATYFAATIATAFN